MSSIWKHCKAPCRQPKNKSPIILAVAEVHMGLIDLEQYAPIILEQRAGSVPVAVHLDHGQAFSSFVKALRWALPQLCSMAQPLPMRKMPQNQEIVRLAHTVGASVEAGWDTSPAEGDQPRVADHFVYRSGRPAVCPEESMPWLSPWAASTVSTGYTGTGYPRLAQFGSGSAFSHPRRLWQSDDDFRGQLPMGLPDQCLYGHVPGSYG